MTKNASKQSGKDRKSGPAAGKKKEQGGAAKKPVNPSKSVLLLPTLTTLRKETDATADEIDNSDPKAARKYGKEKVKKLHGMVDADWHDGWEDQGNVSPLNTSRGIAFERCHEVKRALADSWENMKSIPARIDTADVFAEADWESCTIAVDGLAKPLKFFGPVNFFSEVWPVILWAAASNKQVGDELLYRWIKDADDYGAALPDSTGTSGLLLGVDEIKDASGNVVREATPGLRTAKKGADLKKGHKRLKKLFANRSLWGDLRSRKISYRRKRFRDRRFDNDDSGYGSRSEGWISDEERDEAASSPYY